MTTGYGWAGTILNVDLTNMKVSKEPLSVEFAAKYIGGSGFGARILYDEVSLGDNALEPENVIIIGQGPLSGTAAPTNGRYYGFRGCDREGVPTKEKLESLGLKDVADDLAGRGILKTGSV